MRRLLPLVVLPILVAACSKSDGPSEQPGTKVSFEATADLSGDGFFAFPYPSDLLLDDAGHPSLAGFPNPDVGAAPKALVAKFRAMTEARRGWPVMPAAYFRFDGPLSAQDQTKAYAASLESPLLLADVDPASPDRGKLFPVVASLPAEDAYVLGTLLAVAPRPGFVLAPNRRYAVIVRRSLNDASGQPLGVPGTVARAASGEAISRGARSIDTASVFASLPGLDPASVAAFTVFTTGDVVAELHDLGNRVKAAHAPKIEALGLHAAHPRYCELHGTIRHPQFQKGKPPFDTEGLFEFDQAGLPIVQREETIPVVITVPRAAMPAAGYPLMAYFHGSGGLSVESVERGRTLTKEGEPTPGEGPAHVVAPLGLATASAAFPINPERLPTAGSFDYLNLNNLAAVRDTFRQGVLEQRMFLEALKGLQIPADALTGCDGVSLPAGASAFAFNPDELVAMGHSMGAMYLNMISATEPRIRAAVSSGAGGYWTYFLLETKLVSAIPDLLAAKIGTDSRQLGYLHPVIQLAESALETVDPLVFTPRVGKRPLPGFASRPVYAPAGLNDKYFPPQVLDTLALGYGNRQAGALVWQSMQDALALDGRGGFESYPVTNNVTSVDGTPFTGVVVQYEGDGLADPHNVAFQLDDVKYQYGCFLSTFLATGSATVPAPAALGTPCPGK